MVAFVVHNAFLQHPEVEVGKITQVMGEYSFKQMTWGRRNTALKKKRNKDSHRKERNQKRSNETVENGGWQIRNTRMHQNGHWKTPKIAGVNLLFLVALCSLQRFSEQLKCRKRWFQCSGQCIPLWFSQLPGQRLQICVMFHVDSSEILPKQETTVRSNWDQDVSRARSI